MQHFLRTWKITQNKRKKDCLILLFLDYDGTLTPIVRHPSQAHLSLHVKSLLRKLARSPFCRLSIVSGRKLGEIKRRVGVSGINYVGNHGFEIQTTHRHFIHPQAQKLKNVMKEIRKKLKKILPKQGKVWIEDKTYTLSVHYREASPRQIREAKKLLFEITRPYHKEKKIKIHLGKKVWEIRPYFLWNKGRAVKWLMQYEGKNSYLKKLSIYIGDDTTDEDAFMIVKEKGMGVKVTKEIPKKTKARYYLRDVGEVVKFLKSLSILIQ